MNMNIIAQLITKWRKNMNKEKNYFKIEARYDGIAVSANGRPAFVKSMAALGMAHLFAETGEDELNIDRFITMLRLAHDDKEYFEILKSALSLYAIDEDEGINALAMAMAVAVYADEKENGVMSA